MPTDVLRSLPAVTAAPADFIVPNAAQWVIQVVSAVFDGSGAATPFLPACQIIGPGGDVVATFIDRSSPVAAGGSAEVTYGPFLRTQVTATSTFSNEVILISPGNLRGYWRLEETGPTFADSSGWSGGPTPLTRVVGATSYSTQVTGALPPPQADLAVRFNATPSGGDYIQGASSALWTGVSASFTAAAWVNPTANGGAWRGGIFANNGVVAGAPSHEEGWSLEGVWSGGIVTARLERAVNNVVVAAGSAIPTGTWTFVVGTYDGATIRLYINGALAASQADARPQPTDSEGFPRIDRTVQDTTATIGQFLGVIDEVAFWGVVLSPANIASLYAAAS